jgi:hypothetical protein
MALSMALGEPISGDAAAALIRISPRWDPLPMNAPLLERLDSQSIGISHDVDP